MDYHKDQINRATKRLEQAERLMFDAFYRIWAVPEPDDLGELERLGTQLGRNARRASKAKVAIAYHKWCLEDIRLRASLQTPVVSGDSIRLGKWPGGVNLTGRHQMWLTVIAPTTDSRSREYNRWYLSWS